VKDLISSKTASTPSLPVQTPSGPCSDRGELCMSQLVSLFHSALGVLTVVLSIPRNTPANESRSKVVSCQCTSNFVCLLCLSCKRIQYSSWNVSPRCRQSHFHGHTVYVSLQSYLGMGRCRPMPIQVSRDTAVAPCLFRYRATRLSPHASSGIARHGCRPMPLQVSRDVALT
jgi:hypothetical protein